MFYTSIQKATKYSISTVAIAALLLSSTPVEAISVSEATTTARSFFTSIFSEVKAKDANTFPVAEDKPVKKTMAVRLSFYSSDPNQTDSTPCIPADGSDLCIMAQEGLTDAIAANFLPLGTTVRFKDTVIDGVMFPEKIFTVRDRMNTRYNGTRYVDVYIAVLGEDGKVDAKASRARAKELGVKHVEMEVF